MSLILVPPKKKRRVKVTDEYRMARIRRTLIAAQRHASLYIEQVAKGEHADAQVPDAEKTVRTKVNMMLVQGTMAGERARALSEAPKIFGMVMMQARIEDPAQWERMHATVAAGKAIEAEVVPALPEDPDGS